jgi:hypothetical protein
MKLKYHQKMFDLLGIMPEFSAENYKLIADFEAKHRLQLPAALSEWYALANNEDVLRQILPLGHHIVPLYNAFQNTPSFQNLKGNRPFYILVENQGVWHMAVQLLSNNPPVFIRLNEVDESWRLHAHSFSDWLYAWAWDYEIMERDLNCFIAEKSNKKIEKYLIDYDEKGPETFDGNTPYQGERFVRVIKKGKRLTVILQR